MEAPYRQLANDELGKEIVARVNEEFKGTPAEIPETDIRGNKIVGSNPYRLFAMDSEARDLGWRAMLSEESELLLAQNRLPEQGQTYYHLGLVLNFSGQNHDLALRLWGTLPQELREFGGLPAVALALQLRKKDDSLLFTYGEKSQLRTAKILYSNETAGKNFSSRDKELMRTGLPSEFTEGGDRRLYLVAQRKPSLKNLGLLGLYLGRDLLLGSDDGDLTYSGEVGRGGLVRCGATRDDFQNYIMQEIGREHKTEISKLKEQRTRLAGKRDAQLAKAIAFLETK